MNPRSFASLLCIPWPIILPLWALVFSCRMVRHPHLIQSCLNKLLCVGINTSQAYLRSCCSVQFTVWFSTKKRCCFLGNWKTCSGFQHGQFWSPSPLLRYLFRLVCSMQHNFHLCLSCPGLLDWLTVWVVSCTCHRKSNALFLVLFSAFGRCLRVIESLRVLCTAEWSVFLSSPGPYALSFQRHTSVFHFVM